MTTNRPTVLYVVQPSNAIVPTYKMKWGGSHRLSFWHLHALTKADVELHVVAPAGSELELPGADVLLSRTPGLLTVEASRFDDMRAVWREDVLAVMARVDPDVILFQGPDVDMLRAIPVELRPRVIFASHYGFHTQLERRGWLIDHDEIKITAVSGIHRENMGPLRERAVVTRAGIPVESYKFRSTVTRPIEPSLSEAARAFDLSNGKVISQVDRLSRDKSQVATAKAFMQSVLPSQGWRLIIGGNDFLHGKPAAVSDGDERIAYAAEFNDFVATHGRGLIHVLPMLDGHEVEEVYAASSLVIAPYGLDLPGYKEAFGIAPAIAQAVGTPTLISAHVDSTQVENGISGWQMGDEDSLPELLTAIAEDLPRMNRAKVRAWAEEHQNLHRMFSAYGDIIEQRASQRGKQWSLTELALHDGAAAALRAATPPQQLTPSTLEL